MFATHMRVVCLFLSLFVSGAALAQQTGGTLRGQVGDSSGAVIPGAPVVVSGAGGQRTVQTAADGTYSVPNLAPGSYSVRVLFQGFNPFEAKVDIAAGRTAQLPVTLQVSLEKQEVTVKGEAGAAVNTEPDNNAGALILRQEDLDALPDDPDELASDLQALAGPSAGPNGGQIYIDGFSGGRLPPKESIREIRINQNPFSAEYDQLGFGRIEILTKPGTDKFRGQASFNFSDKTFNSRNPYADNKPDYQQRMFGGNLSGPISKKASFFVDLEKRNIDDNAVVNATVLDSLLNPTALQQAIVTPNRRTEITPRIDYQINTNNTLVVRYEWSHIGQDNAGVGQFSLPSRAYAMKENEHMIRATETAVLSPKVVNETRFQFAHTRVNDQVANSLAAINVLDSFQGGGAQIGNAYNSLNHYELQNFTSISRGAHTIRWGGRARLDTLADYSPNNFGGTFTFNGGPAPVLVNGVPQIDSSTGGYVTQQITSLQRYQLTLQLEQQGLSPAAIRTLGGGATQFTTATGTPLTNVNQADLGIFAQDDWRVRPNLTLSLGLRYETQSNIHDWRDIAPRIGFAWAPGGRGNKQGKTVIRGGFGTFYSRFQENLVLQTLRYNGTNQRQYIIANPDFYPNIPTPASLNALPQTVWRADSNLRAPYILQSAIGIERQLPWNTTIATTLTNTHAVHLLLARNINAPLTAGGAVPYPGAGNINLYESAGIMNQHQWITNVNSRVNRNVSLFAFYVLNYARSDTDGANAFPASQYDVNAEYGRSSLDTRHRFVLGGSVGGPLALRFNPFVIINSGRPFNITTGRDNNGDAIFTDRPAFATDLTRKGVVVTPFGAFDPNPVPGEVIIPRNYGAGPGSVSVNLRMGRTFGFGGTRGERAAGPPGGGGGRGGGGRGPGGGGMRGMGGMGGGGMHGMMGGDSTNQRYNLTLSVSARNILNHVNPGSPIGSLASPLFGQSNALAAGGGPGGGFGGVPANNRRLEVQLRFAF